MANSIKKQFINVDNNKQITFVSASLNMPFSLLSNKADAWPAIFVHLCEVFHAL